MVSDKAVRFRSLHVDGEDARLYGSDDSDDGAIARLFRSMPSFVAIDNEESSYRITLITWFRSELRLKIEPSPPRSVRWFEVNEEAGQTSRIEVTDFAGSQTLAGPLVVAPPEARDDILSRLVLETLTNYDNVVFRTPTTRREYERTQLDGIRRGAFSLEPPGQLLLRFLDQLALALDEPEGTMTRIPAPWAAVLQARDRTDGRRWISDPAILLEPIDGVTIGVDTVVSEPRRWLLYLTAVPDWSIRVAPKAMRDAVRVSATDDRGGRTHRGQKEDN